MGFVRAIVAAPSRKAALEAWGVRDDLFARGTAREVEDADLVKEAVERPGEVLRKPISDSSGFIAAAKPSGTKRSKTAASGAEPKGRSKTPPPRKAIEAAEADLRDQEDKGRAALEAIEADQAALDVRRAQAKSKTAATVKAARRKLDDAKAAYELALTAWDGDDER